MEYSKTFNNKSFSVAIEATLNDELNKLLLKSEMQEDLLFALWLPSDGNKRFTSIINEIVYPETGDKELHGNASFSYKYLLRACRLALEKGKGVALLHSHIGPGWQGLSYDDHDTEEKSFKNVFTATDLPFVGLTLGTDGYWSARVWFYDGYDKITFKWAMTVRCVGTRLNVYFNDSVFPKPPFSQKNKRTVSVWGEYVHSDITRLKIGIIGLGSVGSVVAELLSRMGMSDILLIDYDIVEDHNLDRLCGVFEKDIGQKKVDVIKKSMLKSSTAPALNVDTCDLNISNEHAYIKALDCDVIFCCVDGHLGRHILNHMAFAHLIPVINGGILINISKENDLNFADLTVHTVSPGKPCMKCLNAYDVSLVETERSGLLDDPSYIQGLGDDNSMLKKENISPFSFFLASTEVFHFIVLTTGITDPDYYVEQRYRFKQGVLSKTSVLKCEDNCYFKRITGTADTIYKGFYD